MASALFMNYRPIFEEDYRLYAYHFALQPVQLAEDLSLLQQDIIDFFRAFESKQAIERVLPSKQVFYYPPQNAATLQSLPNFPKDSSVVVELDIETLKARGQLLHAKEFILKGHQLALNEYRLCDQCEKFLSFVHTVKLSVRQDSPEALKRLLAELEERSVRVILTDVEDEAQMRQFAALGFQYFEGFFYTSPIETSLDELTGNQLTLLNLLAEINRPEVAYDQLIRAIEVDVSLVHRLLKAVNHPNMNLNFEVKTLRDAMNFMGLQRLKFWVNSLVMSAFKDVPLELLTTSLVRANFMQQFAGKTALKTQAESFYLTGLLSTLNAYFKVPMRDIVDQLNLADEMNNALTEHQGAMGQTLWSVKQIESGNLAFLQNKQPEKVMQLSNLYMDSLAWSRKRLENLRSA
jgi:EAL and modified HD-GYP domain-containing signal transduction protein